MQNIVNKCKECFVKQTNAYSNDTINSFINMQI